MRSSVVAVGSVILASALLVWWVSMDPAPDEPAAPSAEAQVEVPGLDAGTGSAKAPAVIVGEPLLFGVVTLNGQPTTAIVHVGLDEVVAGADGRFAWAGAASSDPIVVFASRGAARSETVSITIDPGQAQGVALELFDPVLVAGQVLAAADRRPIPGAQVTFEGTAPVRTGADGTFLIDALFPWVSEVSVQASAGWARHTQPVRITPGRQNTVVVLLESERVIAGHVFDGAGAAAAGATVVVTRVGAPSATTVSGTDGSFSFPHVPLAAHQVAAHRGSERAPMVMTGPTSDLILTLGSGSTLALTVLRPGKSAADLECTLTDVGVPGDGAIAVSDEKGAARFEGLLPGARVAWARERGGRWRWLTNLWVKPGANEASGTLPDDGREMKIEVIDGLTHQALVGAVVTIGGQSQVTDVSGSTTFVDVADQRAIASAKGFEPGEAYLSIKRSRALIQLFRKRRLHGSAVGPDGKRIPRLMIGGSTIATGPEGQFEKAIPGSAYPRKEYLLCPDCMPLEVEIPEGDTDVDLGRKVLQRGGVFDVTVTLPDGSPAAFAQVWMRLDRGDRSKRAPRGAHILVDDNGQAKIPVDLRERWLVATRADFATSDHDLVSAQVAAGQTTSVALRLRAPAFAEGIVTRAGRAVRGIEVSEPEDGHRTLTDGAGRYRLGPLTPGNHHLTVGLSDKFTSFGEGSRREVNFALGARLVVEADFRLDGPTTIYALPRRIDLQKVRYADRKALIEQATRLVTETPEALFESIAPGEWTVWTVVDFSWVGLNVTVPEQGEVRVRLTSRRWR